MLADYTVGDSALKETRSQDQRSLVATLSNVYRAVSSRVVSHPSIMAKRSQQSLVRWFYSDTIVHSTPDSLLTAEITFRRLH